MVNRKLLIEKGKEYFEGNEVSKGQYFMRENKFLELIEECRIDETDNKVMHRIFKKYIKSYESIKTLEENNLADTEQIDQLKHNLLEDIMITFRSEVE